MADVAVLPPSCVVTVIVAFPADTAVTSPLAFTVATAVLFELHVTFLLVALAGRTVAVNCCVAPIEIEADVGDTDTLSTGTLHELTVTCAVAVKPPSCVVTVMLAVPAATPVTTPEALTVATEGLFDDHDTFLFVAFEGATFAVN
jgi:hypothetical protein